MGPPFSGKYSNKYHPWVKEMHNTQAVRNVGQKAAQMGFTEIMINRCFYAIDIFAQSCLYILPASTPDASDFSAARFDPALKASSYLSDLFSDVKNIGHKRAGTANLYIRGSRSRSGLKSIPAPILIFDEVDEMDQGQVILALERASGQTEKLFWFISTPTVHNFGINAEYTDSTQEHFYFKCPHCNAWTELIFPECLSIIGDDHRDSENLKKSYLKCKECQVKLNHNSKSEWLKDGSWEASFAGRDTRGFYINQLYSPTVSPVELARSYLKSLTNPAEEQEFYNSKLGQPHEVEGARIKDEEIEACTGSHINGSTKARSGLVTMGVDVGAQLHCEIIEWKTPQSITGVEILPQTRGRVLLATTVREFHELDALMHKYRIIYCVIDANPERRLARDFALRFPGHVKICFYGKSISGKSISVGTEQEYTINVDRTSWLDAALGRFKDKTITLPLDISRTYQDQIKAPVKIYEKDAQDNPIARYVNGGAPDHFAHARNYSEISLVFALQFAKMLDITGIF